MADNKELAARRKTRLRFQLRRKAGGRPRLSVFRSGRHIYAQVIDDQAGHTLVSASTLLDDLKVDGHKGNIDAAPAACTRAMSSVVAALGTTTAATPA